MNGSLSSPTRGYTHLQKPKDLLRALCNVFATTLGNEAA
jgi:hypothetical protein